jgi:hypothetical protein
MRLDSSGRLLVGSSTSPSAGSGQYAKIASIGNTLSASGDGRIVLGRGAAATSLSEDQNIGSVLFTDNTGLTFAAFGADVDGTTGSGDYPARLFFSTTADGASTPTERLKIKNDGVSLFESSSHVVTATTSAGAGTSKYLYRGQHSSGSTIVFNVWSNGNVESATNSYGSISDVKLKENIVDANSQWDDLKAIQVRNYNFKESTGQQTHTQLGVVAQEIETVSPGLVYNTADVDDEGNDLGTVTKRVNYSVLYMKAVKALQEAMDRIETLEAKVAALEAG